MARYLEDDDLDEVYYENAIDSEYLDAVSSAGGFSRSSRTFPPLPKAAPRLQVRSTSNVLSRLEQFVEDADDYNEEVDTGPSYSNTNYISNSCNNTVVFSRPPYVQFRLSRQQYCLVMHLLSTS